MKKIFVMLTVALIGLSAMAQPRFGLKVGFDLTNLWGKDIKHGVRPNYQVGALMEYKFNDRIGISPEVVFASQGGKFDILGVKTKYTLNYINVPVLLKFYATEDFSIDFGPQVGFNVYSHLITEPAGVKVDTNIKDDVKTVDFGLGLGATYNLTENAFVQARYTLGLTKISKDGSDVKNGNIQIAFGWKF